LIQFNGTLLFCTVPTPDVSIVPFSPIQGAIVGSPQEIHCTIGTVGGVELSSVMISWMGPGGDTIRNDSRVTISQIISINNDYINTLEFTYLKEGDEGIYTCEVMILETTASDYITIKNLTGKLAFACTTQAVVGLPKNLHKFCLALTDFLKKFCI